MSKTLVTVAAVLTLVVLYLNVLAGPASGQPLDWAITGCEVFEGPGPDSLTLSLRIGLIEAPMSGEFEATVDVYLNIDPWEAPHPLVGIIIPGAPCPQDVFCQTPIPFCATSTYDYKGEAYLDTWGCFRNFEEFNCFCAPRRDPPSKQKKIAKPIAAPPGSFFDVFVDLDNLVPETNEGNNHCRVAYGPPTATEHPSWGTVKRLHR